MQVEISFIFPHVLRELPVSLLIPYPAQRPRTVANLAFMATGQLPLPEELTRALHLDPSSVAYPSTEDARAAGLVPLSDSAVIRIDKTTVMEIGSSTTHSIFGGFLPDEPLQIPADVAARGQSIAATMSLLKAGTLLYGNMGMPNTQASRFYLLLTTLTTAEQREEFGGFAPLGMVTSGLAELQRAVSQTAVQPRTLAPKKKVVVSACRMQLDYAQLSGAGTRTSLGSAQPSAAPVDGTPGERRAAVPQERLAGRVRRRDEDEEKENEEGATAARSAVQGRSAEAEDSETPGKEGFFRMSARFPKAVAQAVASAGGSALKRRRAEAYVTGADGAPELRTTAIAPGESGGDDEGGSAGFHFFRAQQDAFMNDIEAIKDIQLERHNRRSNKSKKKQAYSRKNRNAGLPKSSARRASSSSSSGGASAQRGSGKARPMKKVTKRY